MAVQMGCGHGALVVCVVGPGNNGGDALVVARHLAIAGASVEIVFLAEKDGTFRPRGDAAVQVEIVRAMGVPSRSVCDPVCDPPLASTLAAADLLVDGLFGTGLDRPLGGAAAALVMAINGAGRPVLALDLPSGLDCDTGEPLGDACIRASATATFVAPKIGFDNPVATGFTGSVHVVAIGAPPDWPLQPVPGVWGAAEHVPHDGAPPPTSSG